MLCYSLNGDTIVAVNDDYVPGPSEILFPDYATEEQLQRAFPDRINIKQIKERQELANKINHEVNQYIFDKYDAGTQMSFAALYAGPDSTAEIKVDIESVWAWIKTVLKHYYETKYSILDGKSYTWDLSQFDDKDPKVMLGDLVMGLK